MERSCSAVSPEVEPTYRRSPRSSTGPVRQAVGSNLSEPNDESTETLPTLVVRKGPCSFSDLKREIDGISEAMITRRLADVLEKGLVETRTRASTPPRREYTLTPAGERIGAFLTEMDSILSVGGDGEETYLISTI
jgi:hypothetical protein